MENTLITVKTPWLFTLSALASVRSCSGVQVSSGPRGHSSPREGGHSDVNLYTWWWTIPETTYMSKTVELSLPLYSKIFKTRIKSTLPSAPSQTHAEEKFIHSSVAFPKIICMKSLKSLFHFCPKIYLGWGWGGNPEAKFILVSVFTLLWLLWVLFESVVKALND